MAHSSDLTNTSTDTDYRRCALARFAQVQAYMRAGRDLLLRGLEARRTLSRMDARLALEVGDIFIRCAREAYRGLQSDFRTASQAMRDASAGRATWADGGALLDSVAVESANDLLGVGQWSIWTEDLVPRTRPEIAERRARRLWAGGYASQCGS